MSKKFEHWLKLNGYKPKPCNCGGPQYGTDHSPDCEYEVSALDLQDQFDDEMAGPFEFSETPKGYDARNKWAERYDDLNGAPEGDWDR